MEPKRNRIRYSILSLLVFGLLCSCSTSTPNTITPVFTIIPSNTPIQPTPSPGPTEVTFQVTFDGRKCDALGLSEVPTGEYSFQLNNQSDLRVDIAVMHLIDDHTYQDLLDLQNEHGEPFVRVYWMSLPNYYTRDHKVWHYSLDEPGEHAVLILQHVHVGMWICEPFQVIEAGSE